MRFSQTERRGALMEKISDIDNERFKEKYPNLAREISKKTKAISLDAVRTDSEEARKATYKDRAKGPTIIDFLRLCDTEDEAIEIIDYFKEKRKINSERASKLKRQLSDLGLRSFGPKREPGEY